MAEIQFTDEEIARVEALSEQFADIWRSVAGSGAQMMEELLHYTHCKLNGECVCSTPRPLPENEKKAPDYRLEYNNHNDVYAWWVVNDNEDPQDDAYWVSGPHARYHSAEEQMNRLTGKVSA